MSEWKPIDSAPKDGTPFIALNYDSEVWVSRIDEDGRFQFRANYRIEPRSFETYVFDGIEYQREDKEFAAKHERWRNDWMLWTRLYEFAPTHWTELPAPPTT